MLLQQASHTPSFGGFGLTKRSLASGVAKAIPVLGGIVSAGVTAATMQPMGKRLKNHLRELKYASPDAEGEPKPVQL